MSRRTLPVALLTVLSLAAPAAAAPPAHDAPEVLPYDFAAPCAGFDLLVRGVETVTRTTSFDRAGQAVRVTVHDRFVESDTNATTGVTVRFSGVRHQVFDL